MVAGLPKSALLRPAAACRETAGPRRQVTRMMPIGVPRVPYRTPKEGSWQWVDIWNCLYRERIIFLSKAVDDELGNQLVATMLYLDSENKKDMNLYINCSGGEVVPCLAIHDTMRHVKSDVGTVGFGGCMGMSGFLLAVGKKVRRGACEGQGCGTMPWCSSHSFSHSLCCLERGMRGVWSGGVEWCGRVGYCSWLERGMPAAGAPGAAA